MKRIVSFILLLIVVAGFGVYAQTQQPVRWRTFVKATGENEGVVTFRALVASGWHLYGLQLPDNGPKPTVFDFKGSKGIEFTGKLTPARKALVVKDPLFDRELSWWDSNIEFSIPFKVNGPDPVLHCVVNYMACDGTTCRPPARETISTPIKLNKK